MACTAQGDKAAQASSPGQQPGNDHEQQHDGTLQGLRPEDKRKVASLLQQVVDLRVEVQRLTDAEQVRRLLAAVQLSSVNGAPHAQAASRPMATWLRWRRAG